jgi:hypothetical protein
MEFKINDKDIAKSKKAFKEAVAKGQGFVSVKNVSDIFEPSYIGDIRLAPVGKHTAVGPDPMTKRNWFASVEIFGDGTIKVA